jgi:hypothetical protein
MSPFSIVARQHRAGRQHRRSAASCWSAASSLDSIVLVDSIVARLRPSRRVVALGTDDELPDRESP